MIATAVFILIAAGAYAETRMFVVNVGKGDAIIVKTEDAAYLIDTGKSGSFEALTQALEYMNVDSLDGVFMTHTDKDHSGGLKKLFKSGIEVKNWYAPAFFTGEQADNPIVKATKKGDITVNWLRAGDCVDGLFSVLAPIEKNEINEDDNSLVMMLKTADGKVLLTGDMEYGEEYTLLKSGAELECDILKVPNHADDDTCSQAFIEKLGARVALISTDPYDKPGTPDADLLALLEKAGMQAYRTDFSETGILVTIREGEIEVEIK